MRTGAARHCTYFARCQIATHQSTRSTHGNLYCSTIIQTAWHGSSCCSLLSVHVPSTGVFVNTSFSCCRNSSNWNFYWQNDFYVLHVSLPTHTLAMLVAPKRHIGLTAYLEVSILQLCSVRHSQYLVIYYTSVNAEPCVYLSHLNVICFVRLHGMLARK